jgi:hypothetical protein
MTFTWQSLIVALSAIYNGSKEENLGGIQAGDRETKMKITKTKLVRIIKEEVENIMYESWADMLAATKEIEADDAKVRGAETEARRAKEEDEMLMKMPELMNPDSTDPLSFIKFQEEYHEDSRLTEKIKQILGNAENLGAEMQRYMKNVIDFKRSGGKKGHQYTPEPHFARYMKTLASWIELGHKDLRNHIASIMAEYIQDHLLGGITSAVASGYVDPEDAGMEPYGDED